MPVSTAPTASPRLFAALFTCVTVYGLTHGLVTPLLSLILEARGTERTWIGLLAAMPAFGMLTVSPLIPRLIVAAGIRRFLLLCLSLDLVLVLLLPLLDNLYVWMALRVLMGASVNGLFIASETWINEIAAERSRGRLMGLYNAVLTAAFAAGPLLIVLTGSAGWAPFLLGAALLALAMLPLYWTGTGTPTMAGQASFGVWSFARLAPTLTAAVLLFALMEFVTMGLMPVYGVRSGLNEASAALMLTALGLGGVALQLPIGWLADKVDRRRLLLVCGAAGGAGALLLAPLAEAGGAALWLLLFFWGGVFSGMYTVAMTMIGSMFRGPDLAMANASVGMLWGLASLFGPSLTGAAMDVWDPHGLPAVLALSSAVFLVVGLRRARRRNSNR